MSDDQSDLVLQVVMEVGGDSSVTAVDVAEHPVVAPLAAGRGELTGLALWLMAERHQVQPPCTLLHARSSLDIQGSVTMQTSTLILHVTLANVRNLTRAACRLRFDYRPQLFRFCLRATAVVHSAAMVRISTLRVLLLQGPRSAHAPFLATLPAATLSPLLWNEEQLGWIKGSPVVAEARARRAALEAEWAGIAETVAADPSLYPPGDDPKTWPEACCAERRIALVVPCVRHHPFCCSTDFSDPQILLALANGRTL